jgi:hypothetical protein
MLMDKELIFSDAQAITADAASTVALDTNYIGRAIEEPWLVVNVETTLDTAGEAGTLVVKLQVDDNASFTSAIDLFTSQSFAEADLASGKNLVKIRLPEGLEQHIRVYYDVNDADPFTAGKVDAFLVNGVNLY